MRRSSATGSTCAGSSGCRDRRRAINTGSNFTYVPFGRKGALLWLLFTLDWKSSKALAKKTTRNLWFLGGFLVGLTFGIVEDFPSILETLSSFATHAPWTGVVGAGIYFAQARGRRLLLASLYLTAVGAHMAWNSGVHLVSPFLLSLSLALASIAILGVFIGTSSRKLGSSMNGPLWTTSPAGKALK